MSSRIKFTQPILVILSKVYLDKSLYSEIAGMAHGMKEETVTKTRNQKTILQNSKLIRITTYLYLML
jgi:hypothetical protein